MISRLEAGYSTEALAKVDLSAAIRDVVELYEPLADECGVTLEAPTVASLEIDGNRELIAQALSNIVDKCDQILRECFRAREGRGFPGTGRWPSAADRSR